MSLGRINWACVASPSLLSLGHKTAAGSFFTAQGLRAQHCLGLAGRSCAILKFYIKKSISLALLADVSNISFVKAENDTSQIVQNSGKMVVIL